MIVVITGRNTGMHCFNIQKQEPGQSAQDFIVNNINIF